MTGRTFTHPSVLTAGVAEGRAAHREMLAGFLGGSS